MKRLKYITVLLCVFMAQAALAANDYWVWVDKNGVTNYSQQSPKNHAATHILQSGPYGYPQTQEDARRPGMAPPPAPAADSKPAPAKPKAAAPVDPNKLIVAKKAKLMRQAASIKRKNCEQAQSNMKQLQRPRLRVTDPDGKTHVLSPQEKQTQLDRTQAAIKHNC